MKKDKELIDEKEKNKIENKVEEVKETKKDKKADKETKKLSKEKTDKTNKKLLLNSVISKETYTLGVTITLAFCLVIILALLTFVLDKRVVPEIDLTGSRIHSLTKESQEYIKNIDQEIVISVDERLNYKQITSILNKITKLNDKISISVMPAEEQNTQGGNGYPTTIFVEAKNRDDMAISFFDIEYDSTVIEYTTNKQYSLFEQSLINAMKSVINAETVDNPSLAFLVGHQEPELNTELITLYTELRSFGFMPISLDLKKEKIPESVNTIALIGLREDISKDEYSKLLEFQARGGNFVIATTFTLDAITPNFNKLLSSYGLKIPAGNVIDYRDQNRYQVLQENDVIRKYNNILLPIASKDSEISKILSFENTVPMFPFPSKIDFEPEEELIKKNLTFEHIVMSSDKALFKKEVTDQDISNYELAEGTETELFILGTKAKKSLGEDRESKAVVYSNFLFMTDYMIKDLFETDIILMYDNLRLAKNSFTKISPLNEKMIKVAKPIIVSQYKRNVLVLTRDKIFAYTAYALPVFLVFGLGMVRLYKLGYFAKYGYDYNPKNKKEKNS